MFIFIIVDRSWDYIKALPGYMAQLLTFGFMIGFLILISTIVLGVFMYIITIQKKQTFGIMKVQGINIGREMQNGNNEI